MARTTTTAPAPHAPRSAAGTATGPAPATIVPGAGGSPAAAILAALSAGRGGATVAVIAGRAGLSVPVARQALLACEKDGTATRVKGSRPGIADTWTPAPAPAIEATPAGAPGAGGPAGVVQPAEAAGTEAATGQPAEADGTADPGQVTLAGGTAGGQLARGAAPGPDPAVLSEAAGAALAIAQAADEARKALAAEDLGAALTALDAAREQAAQGRRVIKAAASGRRAPGTRPGALRELVEEHLRKFPDTAFTPHQVGKVLTRSARRGRQRPGQARQPRYRATGHRQAPHLPAHPRRPRARPGRGRRPCGRRPQRRLTGRTRRHAAGTAGRRPGLVPSAQVPAEYLRPAVLHATGRGRFPPRRPWPLAARSIRPLTCTGT